MLDMHRYDRRIQISLFEGCSVSLAIEAPRNRRVEVVRGEEERTCPL